MAKGTDLRLGTLLTVLAGVVVVGACEGSNSSAVSSGGDAQLPSLSAFKFVCRGGSNGIDGQTNSAGFGLQDAEVPSFDKLKEEAIKGNDALQGDTPNGAQVKGSFSSSGSGTKYKEVTSSSYQNTTITTSKDVLQVVPIANSGQPVDFMVLPKGGLFDEKGSKLNCVQFAEKLSDFAKKSAAKVNEFVLHPNVATFQDGSKINVLRFSSKKDVPTPMVGLEDEEFQCLNAPSQQSCAKVLPMAEAENKPEKLALGLYQLMVPAVRKVTKGEQRFYANIGDFLRTMNLSSQPVVVPQERTMQGTVWCNPGFINKCLASGLKESCVSAAKTDADTGKAICQRSEDEGLLKLDINKSRACLAAKPNATSLGECAIRPD